MPPRKRRRRDGCAWSVFYEASPERHAEVAARGRAKSLQVRQAKAAERREAAVRLLKQGESIRQVARQMGVSKSAVGRYAQASLSEKR